MAKGPEIPKTDSAEIEILIERLKQNKLERRDVELIERLLRTVDAIYKMASTHFLQHNPLMPPVCGAI